jgi:hypothetical protein
MPLILIDRCWMPLCFAALASLLVAQGPGGPPPADVNVGGLIAELCDPAAAIREARLPYVQRQSTSGRAPFARREIDLEREGKLDCAVLAELAGPGAMVELRCSSSRGRIFVLLDGDPVPRMDLNLENVSQGLIPVLRPPLSEKIGEALVLRLPVTFNRDLKILSADEDLRLQIQHRRYRGEPSLEKFHMKNALFGLFPLQEGLARLAGALEAPADGATPKPLVAKTADATLSLAAGAREVIFEREGPFVLNRLSFEEFAPFASLAELQKIRLIAECDGKTTISVSLAELFGDAASFRTRQSPRRQRSEPLANALRRRCFAIPMPVAKSLRLRLANDGASAKENMRWFFDGAERKWEKGDRHLHAKTESRPVASWGAQTRISWQKFPRPVTVVSESLRWGHKPSSSDQILRWRGSEETEIPLGARFSLQPGSWLFGESQVDGGAFYCLREHGLTAPDLGTDEGVDLLLAGTAASTAGATLTISGTTFWYQ